MITRTRAMGKRLIPAIWVAAAMIGYVGGANEAAAQTPVAPAAGVPAAAAPGGAAKGGAPAGAAIKDYSKGFEQFLKLGLPDAAKAEYVNLQAYLSDMHEYMGSGLNVKLAGNAWMLEETPKVKGKFIYQGARVIEVYDQETIEKETRQKMEEFQKTNKNTRAVFSWTGGGSEERVTGRWKKVDLKKDIEKTLTALKKLEGKSERHDMFSYSKTYGTLCIDAAHYYRKGFTNEANEIVGFLFSRSGDPKLVIGQAVDRLAETQYAEAYANFRKDHDWAAFGKRLDTLTGQFGASWQKAPGARKLSEEVKKRGAQPQPPEPAGEGLTAEDKALAAELAAVPPSGKPQGPYANYPRMYRRGYYHSMGGGALWILPHETPRLPVPTAAKADETALEKITKRGMKSVPLLLALLKDDSLTYLDRGEATGNSRGDSPYGDFHYMERQMREGAAAEEMARKVYDSMSRPASRAEIASALLKPLPLREKQPQRRYRESEETRDEMQESCKAWYEANKGKTPKELARLYMENGDESQQSAAMSYLMKKGSEEDFQAIEKRFLESSDPMALYRMNQYVTERGEKAKPFVEKLEARLKETPGGGGDNELFKNQDAARMMKEQIEGLKALVSSKPLEAVLAEIATGEKTMEETSSEIYQAMRKEKPERMLTLLLDAALKAKEPGMVSALVSMAASAGQMGGSGGFVMDMDGIVTSEDGAEEATQAPPDAEAKATGPKIATHAAQWKKLLADSRPVEGGMPGATMTIGDSAAMVMNGIYGQATPDPRGQAGGTFLGKRTLALYRTRAQGLLDGKSASDLPAFPSSTDITEDKQKAAAAKIMNAAEGSLEPTLAALTDEELIALLKKIRKDKALNAKLAPTANRVKDVSVDSALAAQATELETVRGRPLDRAAVEKVFGVCKRLVSGGKVVDCVIGRRLGLDGIEIRIREIAPASKEYKTMRESGVLRPSDTPEIAGTVADSGGHGSGIWLLDAGTGGRPAAVSPSPEDAMLDEIVAGMESEMRKRMTEDQNDFWKAVEKFNGGAGNVGRPGVISFIGKPVLKADAPAAPASGAPAATSPAAGAGSGLKTAK